MEDVVEVEFDGALGDAEAVGDFFVGEAFGDESEDLMFAGGEGVGLSFGMGGNDFKFLSFVEGLVDEAAEGGDDDARLEIICGQGVLVGGELFTHMVQGVEESGEVEVWVVVVHVFTLQHFGVMRKNIFCQRIFYLVSLKCFRTRMALKVFQRLGPPVFSISKWVCPGCFA